MKMKETLIIDLTKLLMVNMAALLAAWSIPDLIKIGELWGIVFQNGVLFLTCVYTGIRIWQSLKKEER